MTVVYTHEVQTGRRGFGNFPKLLLRWRGSIYKLILFDLVTYICLYYAINIVYRFTLSNKPDEDEWRRRFHELVGYCEKSGREFPLQFVLGFYITQVVTRWSAQFMAIPWPDTMAIIVATAVQGQDERGRLLRRTIIRYINLCLIITFASVSPQAKKRFPTLEHMVEAGFLLPHEKEAIESLDEKVDCPKYFVPLVWAGALGAKARKEGRIVDDIALFHMVKEICKFRLGAGDLLSYDWICIPLVYTQAVTIAVYFYFLASLIGKQMINQEDKVDLYVAVFSFLEFFFLMGWLKVAEVLINPFGEDDDDFEVNWIIDRHIMVSYMIVDEMNTEFPEMVKDRYWELGVPDELYYTEESLKYRKEGYLGSAIAAKETYNENAAMVLDSESKKGESVANMQGEGEGKDALTPEPPPEPAPVSAVALTQEQPKRNSKESKRPSK